jgi:hypothetical protein
MIALMPERGVGHGRKAKQPSLDPVRSRITLPQDAHILWGKANAAISRYSSTSVATRPWCRNKPKASSKGSQMGEAPSRGPPCWNSQTTSARLSRFYPARRHGTAGWPAPEGSSVPGIVTRAVRCLWAAKGVTCMQPFLPGSGIKFKQSSLSQPPSTIST